MVQRLAGVKLAGRFEKLKFSALIEPVKQELIRQQARCVVVCGIEAHVCVLQTCLDLVEAGYVTAVALDAVGSRKDTDQDAAIERMKQVGVVPTTVESILFEMLGEASGPTFKALLEVVK